MTDLLLAAAVDSVSWCVTADVVKHGNRLAHDFADVDGWHVVGFAEATHHPSGVRRATPPVIAAFPAAQWARIERNLERVALLDPHMETEQ